MELDTLSYAMGLKNGGGGGSGTSNYNDLSNKPSIGGVTLSGNKSASDLGLVASETGKGLSANDYTDTEKTKLSGIEAGAEVNVQADWDEADSSADGFIKNKPTIPAAVTVDSALDANSTNPVENKAVYAAIGGKQDMLTFDNAPAAGSTNPVTSQGILSALGSVSGGAPTGTVIFFAGLTAPFGYLACDGTVYNIADYVGLAAFFETNYGAKNYWGGNGNTTFAVPDWRGEFFRGAGTQSRSGQGSGTAVGVHQDGTFIPWINVDNNYKNIFVWSNSGNNRPLNADASIQSGVKKGQSWNTNLSPWDSGYDATHLAIRPTNTSLLVCIKT